MTEALVQNDLRAKSRIVEMLCELNAKIDNLADAVSLRTYDMDDAAEMYGLDVSALSSTPWRLPNYGRYDLIGRRGRWMERTWRNWYCQSDADRRANWDAMSASERLAARGFSE